MAEEKRYYATEGWDRESIHTELDDAIEHEIEQFEGDDSDPLPETLTILVLKEVEAEPGESFVESLFGLLEDHHGQYTEDTLSKSAEAKVRKLVEYFATDAYRAMGLTKLEETGDEVEVDVQEWLQEHPTRCEWAREVAKGGSCAGSASCASPSPTVSSAPSLEHSEGWAPMADEWKAEMPPRHHPRAHASDDRVCSEGDVEALVTRANEELGKVRAERDAALARVRELTEWRPMETAPVGERILVLLPGGMPLVSLASMRPDGELDWQRGGGYVIDRQHLPVAWLPLPEPPKEGAR